VDGRTDSSNDNVFESVESEQGILLLNTEKKILSCTVQIVFSSNGKQVCLSHDPTFWISKVILTVTVSLSPCERNIFFF
jgi:hypothetical protein